MAAVAFAPRPLLRAVRRLKRILIAERPPRCSTAVIASLGGGVATWQATGTVMRELRVYEELCRRGLPVTLYTFDRPADVPGRLSAAYALSWAVTRRTAGRRHAALITNQAHAGWPAIVLGRVWRTPVIARCGYVFSEQAATMGWHDRRARRRAAWEAWTHRHAAISFLPTDDLIAWCRSHMPGFESCRVRRVPNAIDTNLFAPRPRTPVATDVLAVGRLHPEKRLSLLVAAAATIPGLRLTFVGDGPDRGLLEAEAARHGVTVRFIARVGNEELPALYRNSAAFAIVSVREGNPKALLEAMACGCACIGTEAPGIRNVIRHGVSGLLCGSTPLEVAAAIRAVLGDRDLRERLGAVAREQVVCENSLPHILAIYEDAIVSLATGEPLWPPRVTNGAAV
jgi:glycosyltransferase involved in cell wall biosynthesis